MKTPQSWKACSVATLMMLLPASITAQVHFPFAHQASISSFAGQDLPAQDRSASATLVLTHSSTEVNAKAVERNLGSTSSPSGISAPTEAPVSGPTAGFPVISTTTVPVTVPAGSQSTGAPSNSLYPSLEVVEGPMFFSNIPTVGALTANPSKLTLLPSSDFPTFSPSTLTPAPHRSKPTKHPTLKPTKRPRTPRPFTNSSSGPSPEPTVQTTPNPSFAVTAQPTPSPSFAVTTPPTPSPSVAVTAQPTPSPSFDATAQPTPSPSFDATAQATPSPSFDATAQATPSPSFDATAQPTPSPSVAATAQPTPKPSRRPSESPTGNPTGGPTSTSPTPVPVAVGSPTGNPTSASPTQRPSNFPTTKPSFGPTDKQTPVPTDSQRTSTPSVLITVGPTAVVTTFPSFAPQLFPTTRQPTKDPTPVPTDPPSPRPTPKPTNKPTLSLSTPVPTYISPGNTATPTTLLSTPNPMNAPTFSLSTPVPTYISPGSTDTPTTLPSTPNPINAPAASLSTPVPTYISPGSTDTPTTLLIPSNGQTIAPSSEPLPSPIGSPSDPSSTPPTLNLTPSPTQFPSVPTSVTPMLPTPTFSPSSFTTIPPSSASPILDPPGPSSSMAPMPTVTEAPLNSPTPPSPNGPTMPTASPIVDSRFPLMHLTQGNNTMNISPNNPLGPKTEFLWEEVTRKLIEEEIILKIGVENVDELEVRVSVNSQEPPFTSSSTSSTSTRRMFTASSASNVEESTSARSFVAETQDTFLRNTRRTAVTPTSNLKIVFLVDVLIRSPLDMHNINMYIGGTFDSKEDKERYLRALQEADPAFDSAVNVNFVSPILPPVELTSTPTSPVSGGGSGAGGGKTFFIVGAVVIGGSGIVFGALMFLKRHRNQQVMETFYNDTVSKGSFSHLNTLEATMAVAENDYMSHVDAKSDADVSTLGDPVPPRSNDIDQRSLDESICSLDYDFERQYVNDVVSACDISLEDVTHANNMLPKDDDELEAQYCATDEFEVEIPAGMLGLVLESSENGIPRVHTIKASSVLSSLVRVGDRLLSVDGEDVTLMSSSEISRLISSKRDNPIRKLVFMKPPRTTNTTDEADPNVSYATVSIFTE